MVFQLETSDLETFAELVIQRDHWKEADDKAAQLAAGALLQAKTATERANLELNMLNILLLRATENVVAAYCAVYKDDPLP